MIPPGITTTNTDLESTDDELGLHDKHERYLVGAVAKMTAITSISWRSNHSPISIDLLWPMLVRCQTLQHVEINDNLIFNSVASIHSDSDSEQEEQDNGKAPVARPLVVGQTRFYLTSAHVVIAS